MSKLQILTGKDNPLLRNKAAKIDRITPEILQLVADMAQTMKQANGIGIAAPQVGKCLQLFVVDSLAFDQERSKWEFRKIATPPDATKPLAFVNPVISTYPKLAESMIEGCLSLPGWEGKVTRSKRITIKAQTIDGLPLKLQAKGLLAKVLQHEYDHLQGTLICDKWEKPQKVKREKRLHTADRYLDVVFFGDSDYSQIVLKRLKGTPFEPKLVIGKAASYDLPATSYSLGVTAAYGKTIPLEVINKFSKGILNIHPSLLPRYRGPSPLQQAIINGDTKTGVTIALLTSKIDAGPILAQTQVSVDKPYTARELGELLFEQGADLLLAILPNFLNGVLKAQEQDKSQATTTALISKQDGFVNWEEDASLIERKIRAYQPWPMVQTFTEHNNRLMRIQLLQAQVVQNLTGKSQPGTLNTTQNKLIVACGTDALEIISLRPESKRQMSGEEFIRGYHATTFSSYAT